MHTSSDSSVNPSGSPSSTPSPFAENLLKFPTNNGDKTAVNYLHEILVKVPTVHTLSVPSVIAPVSASSVPSVVKYQEIQKEFPVSNYGEKLLAEIAAKTWDDITLTQDHVKFLEKTPGNSNGTYYLVEFLSG